MVLKRLSRRGVSKQSKRTLQHEDDGEGLSSEETAPPPPPQAPAILASEPQPIGQNDDGRLSDGDEVGAEKESEARVLEGKDEDDSTPPSKPVDDGASEEQQQEEESDKESSIATSAEVENASRNSAVESQEEEEDNDTAEVEAVDDHDETKNYEYNENELGFCFSANTVRAANHDAVATASAAGTEETSLLVYDNTEEAEGEDDVHHHKSQEEPVVQQVDSALELVQGDAKESSNSPEEEVRDEDTGAAPVEPVGEEEAQSEQQQAPEEGLDDDKVIEEENEPPDKNQVCNSGEEEREREMESLKQSLADAEAKLAVSTEELEQAQLNREEETESRIELEREMDSLKKSLVDAETKLAVSTEELKETHVKNEGAETRFGLGRDVGDLKRSLMDAEAKLLISTAELEQARRQIFEKEEREIQMCTEREEIESTAESIQQEMATLLTEFCSNEGLLEFLLDQSSSAQSSWSLLQPKTDAAKYDGFASQFKTMESMVKGLYKKQAAFLGKIKAHQIASKEASTPSTLPGKDNELIDDLKQKLEKEQAEKKKLESTVRDLRKEIAVLKTKEGSGTGQALGKEQSGKKELESTVEDLQLEIAFLKAKQDCVPTLTSNHTAEKEEIVGKLKQEKNETIDKLKQEKDEIIGKLKQEIEDKKAEAAETITKLVNAKRETDEQVKILRTELHESNLQVEDLEHDLTEASMILQSATKRLKNKRLAGARDGDSHKRSIKSKGEARSTRSHHSHHRSGRNHTIAAPVVFSANKVSATLARSSSEPPSPPSSGKKQQQIHSKFGAFAPPPARVFQKETFV